MPAAAFNPSSKPKPAPAPGVAAPVSSVNPSAVAAAPATAPAKKMSFLSVLKPKTVAEAKPSNQVMLLGNKGVKTIAAVAVETKDGMSANGRTRIVATPGLPRPEGSRVVVITFDNQSSQSLLNHYGDLVDGHGIEVFHLMDPVYEFSDGCIGSSCEHGTNIVKVPYPGWDGSSAESGVIVAAAFKELLVSLRDSRKVGLLVIDHYGKFIEEAAKFFAYFKAKVPLDMKLEPNQWTSRANLLSAIDFLVRSTPMEGGWVIVTGQRDRNEGNEVTTFDNNRKEFAMKEVVASKWADKVIHNWGNVINVTKSEFANGTGYVWEAEVQEGRHPLFPLGSKVNISGRHLGAFLDKGAVTFPADEALAAAAAKDEQALKVTAPLPKR